MAERTRETIERDVLMCLCVHGTTTNKQISEELHINPGQITIALRSLKPYTKTVPSDDGSHPCTLVWDIPLLPKIISAFDCDFNLQSRFLKLTPLHNWIPKPIERFDDLQPPFLIASRPSRYLFSWDNVPGKDEKRLMEYFKVDLDIDQAETVEIHKSDDGKTIHIRNGEKSAKIVIDEGTEKATIKINNKRFCDLNVKKENGKLKLYTCSTVDGYPAHYTVAGTVEKGDDASSVMERHHLSKEYEECIENILKNLPSEKRIKTKLNLENRISRLRGFSDDVKYEDISFVIIKPHLSEQEKIFLEESSKTNWLALKFVSYFLSANCGEMSKIIAHIKSGAGKMFRFLHDDMRRSCLIGLSWCDSHINIPSADYERMEDELFDGFERELSVNWREFFSQLEYFRFFQFLFA